MENRSETQATALLATSFESPDSSSIARADYDIDTDTCVVEFPNGARYQYARFGLALWNRWVQAESKGSFFAKEIRPLLQGVKLP